MSSVSSIVRYNCAGLDIHSRIIVATVGITDPNTNGTEYHQKSFGTLNSDLQCLAKWLLTYNCTDVCMESTGKYWIPPANVLEDFGIHFTLSHPKYVRAIKGKKQTRKIQNGFVSFINTIFLEDLLFLQRRFVSYVRSLVITSNL